jgi:hypothetical protein
MLMFRIRQLMSTFGPLSSRILQRRRDVGLPFWLATVFVLRACARIAPGLNRQISLSRSSRQEISSCATALRLRDGSQLPLKLLPVP